MLYIVSSLPRSGSSMMMRCLINGGLIGAYDNSQEYLNVMFGDDGYQPNGNGFYALEEDFTRPDFYDLYNEKLVKVPCGSLETLCIGEYRLVFLQRNPLEILDSMHRFVPGIWPEEPAVDFYDLVVPTLLTQLKVRTDMSVITLHYADIITSPSTEFQKLVDDGWPINIDDCAAMVEPSLYRFKLEIT